VGQGIPLVPTFPVDYAGAMRWLCTSIRSFATRPEQSFAQHGSGRFSGRYGSALVAAFCIRLEMPSSQFVLWLPGHQMQSPVHGLTSLCFLRDRHFLQIEISSFLFAPSVCTKILKITSKGVWNFFDDDIWKLND